jgi:hypothetical protein
MLHESGRRCRRAAVRGAVTLAATLAACAPTNIVAVESGAEPATPVFEVLPAGGATGWIYGLSVLPCGGDSAVWTIAATGSASLPSRIVYGKTPDGFVNRAGPLPLHPGCYQVYVSESAGTRFHVGRDGRVIADSSTR